MRNAHIIAWALSTYALVAPAQAQQLCELKIAVNNEMAEASRSEARIAERNLSVAEELRKFMDSRKWKPGVAIGLQMTPKESETFGSLTQQNKAGLLAALIESKRTRDARVFGRMARIADQTARYGLEIPPSNTEDYTLLSALVGARELMPVKLEDALKTDGVDKDCTLDKALNLAAKDAIATLQHMPNLDAVNARLNVLMNKYGRPVKLEKMSAQERRSYSEELLPVMQKVQSYSALAEDMVRLQRLNRVSLLQLAARRQDQYTAPGDLKYSGTTWNEWVRIGRISPAQNQDSKIVNVINDKIPAEIVKDLSKLNSQNGVQSKPANQH